MKLRTLKPLLFLTLATPIVTAGIPSLADVDVQTASFIHAENDSKISILERTYNSRSLWNGFFGFGWCAPIEKSFDPMTGRLQHCGQYIQTQLQRKNQNWIRQEKQIFETYNFRGQLMQIKDRKGRVWSLSYDRHGRLARAFSHKQSIDFVYIKDRLARIESRKDPPVFYRFQGSLLKEAQIGKIKTLYQYDEFKNLTRIETQTGNEERPPIQIEYNNSLDQVRQIKVGGCTQDFSYRKTSNLQFQSSVLTRCPSSARREQTFTFTAEPSRIGSWKLKAGTTNRTASGGNDAKQSLP